LLHSETEGLHAPGRMPRGMFVFRNMPIETRGRSFRSKEPENRVSDRAEARLPFPTDSVPDDLSVSGRMRSDRHRRPKSGSTVSSGYRRTTDRQIRTRFAMSAARTAIRERSRDPQRPLRKSEAHVPEAAKADPCR